MMTILRQSRRNFLKSAAATGGAALLASRLPPPARAAAPAGPDLQGLRDKIDHIVVIFQENRSFDHYFGAYQPPGGGAVAGLLDHDGRSIGALPGCKRTRPARPIAICRCPISFPASPTHCSTTGRSRWPATSRRRQRACGIRCTISSACSRRSMAAGWTVSWPWPCPATCVFRRGAGQRSRPR